MPPSIGTGEVEKEPAHIEINGTSAETIPLASAVEDTSAKIEAGSETPAKDQKQAPDMAATEAPAAAE